MIRVNKRVTFTDETDVVNSGTSADSKKRKRSLVAEEVDDDSNEKKDSSSSSDILPAKRAKLPTTNNAEKDCSSSSSDILPAKRAKLPSTNNAEKDCSSSSSDILPAKRAKLPTANNTEKRRGRPPKKSKTTRKSVKHEVIEEEVVVERDEIRGDDKTKTGDDRTSEEAKTGTTSTIGEVIDEDINEINEIQTIVSSAKKTAKSSVGLKSKRKSRQHNSQDEEDCDVDNESKSDEHSESNRSNKPIDVYTDYIKGGTRTGSQSKSPDTNVTDEDNEITGKKGSSKRKIDSDLEVQNLKRKSRKTKDIVKHEKHEKTSDKCADDDTNVEHDMVDDGGIQIDNKQQNRANRKSIKSIKSLKENVKITEKVNSISEDTTIQPKKSKKRMTRHSSVNIFIEEGDNVIKKSDLSSTMNIENLDVRKKRKTSRKPSKTDIIEEEKKDAEEQQRKGDVEKPAKNIKANEKPAKNIKADEKPAKNIKADEKSAKNIKADEKSAKNIKADEKPAKTIKADEKPAKNTKADEKLITTKQNKTRKSMNPKDGGPSIVKATRVRKSKDADAEEETVEMTTKVSRKSKVSPASRTLKVSFDDDTSRKYELTP